MAGSHDPPVRAHPRPREAAASAAEVLQGLGVPMLGSNFDPLDFVMYVLGVLAAVRLDRVVLPTPSPR